MRKQASWFTAIGLGVVCLGISHGIVYSPRIDLQKLYGGPGNLQIMRSPEKVQVWKTEGFLNRQSGSSPEQSAFYKKGGEPKTVPSDLAKSLSKTFESLVLLRR